MSETRQISRYLSKCYIGVVNAALVIGQDKAGAAEAAPA